MIRSDGQESGAPGATVAHINLAVPIMTAAASINSHVDQLRRLYPDTVLAIALMQGAERLVKGSSRLRSPTREALAEQASQTWGRIMAHLGRN